MVALREGRRVADERAAESLGRGLLAVGEVERVLRGMRGAFRLIAEILWETGLRPEQVLGLRVRDILVERRVLVVGRLELVVSQRLADGLASHLARLQAWHEGELRDGLGDAWLSRVDRQRYPFAGRRWCWQFVFPSRQLATDESTGRACRRPLDVSSIDRALVTAAAGAGLGKRVCASSMRHAWTARMIRQGVALHVLQARLGHDHIETTDRYVNLVARAVATADRIAEAAPAASPVRTRDAMPRPHPMLGPLFTWAQAGT